MKKHHHAVWKERTPECESASQCESFPVFDVKKSPVWIQLLSANKKQDAQCEFGSSVWKKEPLSVNSAPQREKNQNAQCESVSQRTKKKQNAQCESASHCESVSQCENP